MKDADLESKLRALRVPERGEDFWDAFPQRVIGQLRASSVERPVRRSSPVRSWAAGAALACLVAGICLGQSPVPKTVCRGLVENEKELRRTVWQFHSNVRALMLDEHGLHRLVEDPL